MFTAVVDGPVPQGGEVAGPGRQASLGHPLDQTFVPAPVAHRTLERDHGQLVPVGAFAQFRAAFQGAVVVHDLHQNTASPT